MYKTLERLNIPLEFNGMKDGLPSSTLGIYSTGPCYLPPEMLVLSSTSHTRPRPSPTTPDTTAARHPGGS